MSSSAFSNPRRSPTESPDNRAFGLSRWFHVASEETGGAFSAWIEEVAPGSGPPLHVHTRESEVFTVLEGSLLFQLEEEQLTAHAGETVVIPRGARHTFHNAGDAPARALIALTPGGGEQFFRDVDAEGLGPADMARIEQIAAEYGLQFVGPPIG